MPDEPPKFEPFEPGLEPEADLRKDAEEPPETLPELPEKILPKIPIASSHINNVQYDNDEGVMFVEFKNGSRYRYSNVDPTVYTAFMHSPSKGNYLHKVMRQVCPCEKMEP